MSYITGHDSFTSQYLLNIYIYCGFITNVQENIFTKINSLDLKNSVNDVWLGGRFNQLAIGNY
jgi:hypothetical protein